MKKVLLLFTAVCLFISPGCKKDSPTEPQPTKPPGYQEDIPWPSLADSPWPMYRADPQNTGRSRYYGAANGALYWKFDSIDTQSGIVVTADSSIIIGSSSRNNPNLYAVSNGNMRWKTSLGQIFNTATVANNNIIYSIVANRLYGISAEGNILIDVALSPSTAQMAVYIGKDGSIYYVGMNKLYALDKFGNVLWTLENATGKQWGTELCFSPDGNTLYINGMSITSVDLSRKTVNWTYGNFITRSAMADAQGNIYFHASDDSGRAGLFSLSPDKSLRWIFNEYEGKGIESYLAIDTKGNIYFDDNINLYSLDYRGELNWAKPLNGISSGYIAVDRDGFIYSYCQKDDKTILTSYADNGSSRWLYAPEESVITGNGIAIGYNQIYLPTWDSKFIYSIK